MLSLTTTAVAAATTDAAAVIAATAAAIATTTATVTATTINFEDKIESLSNCKIFGLRYRSYEYIFWTEGYCQMIFMWHLLDSDSFGWSTNTFYSTLVKPIVLFYLVHLSKHEQL